MQKRKIVYLLSVLMLFVFMFPFQKVDAAKTAKPVLKFGMKSAYVKNLQNDLKTLGFFTVKATGYFGSATKKSVMKFQKKNGLTVDGIVGAKSHAVIDKLLQKTKTQSAKSSATKSIKTQSSRSGELNRNLLIPWFDNAENIFYIGATAKVTDIDTGLSFNVKRTYGYNHADCETLTTKDSQIMEKIFGGKWSWERRAIIVDVDGRKIAASMAGMPHAGREYLPGDIWVDDWRTEGYGPGYNLDKIKGNGMAGHFDIHFLNSRTHNTDMVNEAHQQMVLKAAKSGL